MKTCIAAAVLLLVVGFMHARAVAKGGQQCHTHAQLAFHCH